MSRGFAFESVEERMKTYEAIDRNPISRSLKNFHYAFAGYIVGCMTGDPKLAWEGAKAGWRLSESLRLDKDETR